MSNTDSGRPRVRAATVLALAGALLLTAGTLAACGGSRSTTASQAQNQSGGGQGGGGQGGAGAGQFPGARGTLAAINGRTLQVQNPATGQIAVNYSASTVFAQTQTVAATAIKVGDCVTATGPRVDVSGAAGSASSAPTMPPTTFTATSVQVFAPVNDSCASAGGFGVRGFGGGARPSGSNAVRPSAAPSGRANRGNFGTFAAGKVTAVAADTLTVRTVARGQQPSQLDTITLTSASTITESVPATASNLKVGLCVLATGKADSTGAIAANRIMLSTAGPTGCSSGFGRRPGTSTGA